MFELMLMMIVLSSWLPEIPKVTLNGQVTLANERFR